MKHRGIRPPAQPRTLRSIAEEKGTVPAGFPADLAYDDEAGAPVGAGVAGTYRDSAEQARPSPGAGQAKGSDPKPFK